MSEKSEPERYSLDQMVERLQQRSEVTPNEAGELVTRADGTQAVRVKSRRRRSVQPKQLEKQRKARVKAMQLGASLALLIGFGLVFGIAIVYANSEPFRQGVVKMLEKGLNGRVDLGQYRMSPTRAMAGSAKVEWSDRALIQKMEARGLSAMVRPRVFLGKEFRGPEVMISELAVSFNPAGGGESLGIDDIPEMGFNQLIIKNCNFQWNEEVRPVAWLSRSEVVVSPNLEPGMSLVLLNRGEVQFPGWPKQQLVRAQMEVRGTEVQVASARIKPIGPSTGEMELQGVLKPYQSVGESRLAVKLKGYPMESLLGEEWKRLFMGAIDSADEGRHDNYLLVTQGAGLGASLHTDFNSALASKMTVMNYPFLKFLAVLMGNDWYEHPEFDSGVSGRLERTADGVKFRDFTLSSRNRLVLKFNMESKRDTGLDGTVEVGVPVGLVQAAASPKLKAFFSREENGYYWVKSEIAGSLAMPTDDFRVKFEKMPVPQLEKPKKAADEFEQLTQPGTAGE